MTCFFTQFVLSHASANTTSPNIGEMDSWPSPPQILEGPSPSPSKVSTHGHCHQFLRNKSLMTCFFTQFVLSHASANTTSPNIGEMDSWSSPPQILEGPSPSPSKVSTHGHWHWESWGSSPGAFPQ